MTLYDNAALLENIRVFLRFFLGLSLLFAYLLSHKLPWKTQRQQEFWNSALWWKSGLMCALRYTVYASRFRNKWTNLCANLEIMSISMNASILTFLSITIGPVTNWIFNIYYIQKIYSNIKSDLHFKSSRCLTEKICFIINNFKFSISKVKPLKLSSFHFSKSITLDWNNLKNMLLGLKNFYFTNTFSLYILYYASTIIFEPRFARSKFE